MDRKAPSLAKEGRGGSKKTALQGDYIPRPFGKGEGLGVGEGPSRRGGTGGAKTPLWQRRDGENRKTRLHPFVPNVSTYRSGSFFYFLLLLGISTVGS